MDDITALVLTMGEKTTGRAIESIKKQSLMPADIITIEDVTPFHKALNLGASRVRTEFFVQVDSDMVLDRDCLKKLRTCMAPNVGMVVGHLRDPLLGRISSIKMFRKECFDGIQFSDSISPDTDFGNDILRKGWTIIYALRFDDRSPNLWHTFGEHRPDYTPHYTFSKYLLEGRRYIYRKRLDGLQWHFSLLEQSSHPASLIARIAMAHSIFSEEEKDMLKPYEKQDEFAFLEKFLAGAGDYRIGKFKISPIFMLTHRMAFEKYYKLGIKLRKTMACSAFKHTIDMLQKHSDLFSWIAIVGLCHGLFSENFIREKFEREYSILEKLLPEFGLLFVFKEKLKYARDEVGQINISMTLHSGSE